MSKPLNEHSNIANGKCNSTKKNALHNSYSIVNTYIKKWNPLARAEGIIWRSILYKLCLTPPSWGSISWNLSLCAGKTMKMHFTKSDQGGGGRISAHRTSDKFAARSFLLSLSAYMRATCASNIMRWNKARGARGMIWWPGGTKCCWSLNSRQGSSQRLSSLVSRVNRTMLYQPLKAPPSRALATLSARVKCSFSV